MSAAPPPVAFSIGATVRLALVQVRRAPLRTVGTTVLLSAPVIPAALAIGALMQGGGTTALQGLLGGASPETRGAVVLQPSGHGRMLLAALVALLAFASAWPLAGALTMGARARDTVPRTQETAASWPALALRLVAQCIVVFALAAGVLLLGSLAGRIQFQLPTLVAVPGLVLLGAAAARLSLWPSIASDEGLGAFAALRVTWTRTQGHVLRIVGVAAAVALAVIVPALVAGLVVRTVLDALAWHEVIDLSPVTIDLWALAGLVPALFLGVTLWGLAARALATRVTAHRELA